MVEGDASKYYTSLYDKHDGVAQIEEDELWHKQKLIGILNDTRLIYAGSLVLGLNDALVEFTEILAGFTFSFNNNSIVGATGLVMGFAVSLSMAASGYLSSKENKYSIEHINPGSFEITIIKIKQF